MSAYPDASLSNPPYGIDPSIFPNDPGAGTNYATQQTMEDILQGWGIPDTGPFIDLIRQAVIENWSGYQLIAKVYNTPQFHNMFPGIFRDDGSMRFTPTEYRSITDSYLSTARIYGVTNLSTGQLGSLISGNVSQQEFKDRMTAVQRVTENKTALNSYRDLLKAQGIDTSGIDGDGGLLKFVMGEAPKEFYQLYEQTNVLTAARQQGFVGKNRGVGMAQKIATMTPGISTEVEMQQHFQTLAREAQSWIPASQWAKLGVTKSDLVQLEFGGPRAGAISERVSDVMGQQEQFQQHVYVSGTGQRAAPQAARTGRAQSQ